MSNKYHLFKTNLNINNSISFEIFCQYLKQIID